MRQLFELINKNFSFSKISAITKKAEPHDLPIITISREYGSGGSTVGEVVAKRLGKPWRLYHQEIVNEIAKEASLEKNLINEVDESRVPLIEEIISDFFGRRYINLNSYYKHLIRVLTTIGNRGHAVILGRGANFLFPNALKVRVICEMEERINWLVKYERMTREKAIKVIEDSDRKRKEFCLAVFQHDPRKAHHYDLVVRTGKSVNVHDAADLIVHLARRRFKL